MDLKTSNFRYQYLIQNSFIKLKKIHENQPVNKTSMKPIMGWTDIHFLWAVQTNCSYFESAEFFLSNFGFYNQIRHSSYSNDFLK